MPRVNNVIQQVSQLNTYEQEKVFDFLKTVLMSNMMRFRRNWKRLQKMQPETVR